MLLVTLAGTAVAATVPSARLTFTGTGDDGNVGRVSGYQGRCSTSRPDTTSLAAFDSWWNASRSFATPPPAPKAAGLADTITVAPASGFSSDSTYYFVVRGYDDATPVPNLAGFSNVAVWRPSDQVPPSPVTTLRILP